MAKEGYDDVRRYKLDQAENNREASVLHAYWPIQEAEQELASSTKDLKGWSVRKQGSITPSMTREPVAAADGPKHWASLKWKDIKVGDVIKLNRDDPVRQIWFYYMLMDQIILPILKLWHWMERQT